MIGLCCRRWTATLCPEAVDLDHGFLIRTLLTVALRQAQIAPPHLRTTDQLDPQEGAAEVIPIVAVGWGIISLCTEFWQNKAGILVMCMLLRIFEAGCFSAICFSLTFYRRCELAVPIFCLFAASAVSGARGGLLAYAVRRIEEVWDMPAWRWLMILDAIA